MRPPEAARLPTPWLLLAAVLIAATAIRFVDLGRAAVRSDEINFLEYAARGQSLFALWWDPPWLNQIPLADSIAIIWHWFRPGPPTERTVREPFALLGTLTVAGVAIWLARRRGTAAGVLVAVWMGLLPFHVYQSREAYYYVVAMATAAGMTLCTADMLVRFRRGDGVPLTAYAAWTAWTVAACLTHMSAWVLAATCWLLLAAGGWLSLVSQDRRKHAIGMVAATVVIAAFMDRWFWRAIGELKRVSDGTGHIGVEFAWVAPRVLPFFTAGANAFGVVATVALIAAAVYAFATTTRKDAARLDPLYEVLTLLTVAGFAAVYAYVGAVGGGVAKLAYFSVLLPLFLVWAVTTLDVVAAGLPGRWPTILRTALPCLVALVLATPAWMITRLDGKPSPYRQIRAWLDANLDPGSVVVVDRWFEPWNEMARYAPGKVFVTFTVPDEPYETYRQLRWREVTQQAIEQGKVQAFMRLTRNHESRDGLWTWPETHFAHRAEVVNEVALWLRDRGFVPVDDFYAPHDIRLVTEIFYDRREDVVARKRAAGDRFAVFSGPSLRHLKSGPLAMFPLRTEQFMDWRLLEQEATVDVFNLTDEKQAARVKVRAVAPAGPKRVLGPEDAEFRFADGQLQEWLIGPLELDPGANSIPLTDPGWQTDHRPLLIEDVEVVSEPDSAR